MRSLMAESAPYVSVTSAREGSRVIDKFCQTYIASRTSSVEELTCLGDGQMRLERGLRMLCKNALFEKMSR